MLNKKDFLKYASKLAFPIMIQNLIGTLVNIADTVMLGYVSQTAMAASSLANQYTFILFCLYYGMATGTSVLCAQYWGKGDKKTVERILGLAERISLIVSLVFFVISFSMPTTIMKIFTSSPDTIAAGSEYLRVISFSFMFMGFSQVFMSALRSIGKIMLPSVTYIVSLCVNVICNATFIFGLFGLPKLGVTGVALGTVIARITEVLICLIYSLRSSDVRFRIKYFFAKSGILFQDFMKIATPAVINDVVWSFASSAFAAILGHIGDDMVAANAVAVMVVNIGAIACRGFANATTIIVSQELGKDNIDTAREYGKRMLRITMVVSLVGCVIILALRPLILDFYRDKLTETAIYYLGIFIIMTTWRLVGEGINTCLICGCFRGGGDSRFGMIIDSIFMWLVAVPLTFLAAYVLKLPPIWVYFVMTLDEFEKMPVVANAVAVMVVNIGAIACRGFANATTIIVSQELGKDNIDTAREYGKRMLRITMVVSLVGCVIILALRPLILDFYRDKLTETAIYYLGIFIIMTTWRLVGEGINTCLICGCFRGGGDSRFGMIIDSIFMWLVAVPLTFLAAYVLKLPPIWVYFVMTLDEFEKMPVVFIHYFRGKWLTNITRDFD